MKGKIFGALAIVAVAVLAAGPVYADCSPDKAFSITFGDSGNWDLVFQGAHGGFAADDTTVSGAVIGRVWQPGARATTGDTSAVPGCPDDWWLLAPGGTGTMTIFGDNGADFGSGGQCGSTACPAGALIVVVQTKSTDGMNASYVVGRSAEQTAFPAFDFVRGETANWNLVDMPRPQVTGSSRTLTDVTVSVVLDPPAAAFHSPAVDAQVATGTITGYQLVSFNGLADPGREAALWTNVGSAIPTTAPSANGVILNCPAGTSVFLANRPVYDNGQLSADYVSASTRIACSNLATPGTPGTKPKPITNKKSVSQN